jgi:hypothetical protein
MGGWVQEHIIDIVYSSKRLSVFANSFYFSKSSIIALLPAPVARFFSIFYRNQVQSIEDQFPNKNFLRIKCNLISKARVIF